MEFQQVNNIMHAGVGSASRVRDRWTGKASFRCSPNRGTAVPHEFLKNAGASVEGVNAAPLFLLAGQRVTNDHVEPVGRSRHGGDAQQQLEMAGRLQRVDPAIPKRTF